MPRNEGLVILPRLVWSGTPGLSDPSVSASQSAGITGLDDCIAMDTTRYSKWGGSSEEVPGGPWGRWVHWSRRPLFLALAVLVATVLWAVILSILLSKASTERAALLDGHDLLRTNASKQTAALGALKEEVGDCHSCCSGTQAQLQTTRA
ncbi:CLEC4G isoform 3, partial [Pan troglodytes]